MSMCIIGASQSEPHIYQIQENCCTYGCMCVCMYVAIRRPRVQHAVLQIGEDRQHRARANSNCSSPN